MYFYQERTTLFDSGSFSFQILHSEYFFFPLDRYGCAVTQLIPLGLLKLTNCSLTLFLITYSFSLVLFYYVIFLIIAYGLKDSRVVYVYLLTLCLTYRNTFYFGVSEFSQALALTVLLYAILKNVITKDLTKLRKRMISFLLIYSLYFFHPLSILVIVFTLATIIIQYNQYTNKQIILLLLFSVIWFGYNMFVLSQAQDYQAGRMEGFKEFFITEHEFLSLPSVLYFKKFILGTPIFSFLIGGLSIIVLWLNNKKLLALFFCVYPLAFLMFIFIAYYKGESPNMYEQYYIYFGFFIAVILDATTAKYRLNKTHLFTLIALLMINIQSIYSAHKSPSKKISYIKQITKKGAKYKNKKYFVKTKDYPYSFGWSTWALSYETLLLSSLNENSVVFYVPQDGSEVFSNRVRDKFYYSENIIHPEIKISELNQRFFNLPDSTMYITLNMKHTERYYREKITGTETWLNSVKEKADQNNISIGEMIAIDMKWLAEKEEEKVARIKKQEKDIRDSELWMNDIKRKTKERNIPISEMVRIDAIYILQTIEENDSTLLE